MDKAERAAYHRQWKAKNIEKVRAYQRDYQKRWRRLNPDKVGTAPSQQPSYKTAYKRRVTYGLSNEAFQALLASRDNRCAVCGREFTNCGGTKPQVDHDHSCCEGKVTCGACIRGVLCHDCNTSIGKLGDTAEALSRVVSYLQRTAVRRDKVA